MSFRSVWLDPRRLTDNYRFFWFLSAPHNQFNHTRLLGAVHLEVTGRAEHLGWPASSVGDYRVDSGQVGPQDAGGAALDSVLLVKGFPLCRLVEGVLTGHKGGPFGREGLPSGGVVPKFGHKWRRLWVFCDWPDALQVNWCNLLEFGKFGTGILSEKHWLALEEILFGGRHQLLFVLSLHNDLWHSKFLQAARGVCPLVLRGSQMEYRPGALQIVIILVIACILDRCELDSELLISVLLVVSLMRDVHVLGLHWHLYWQIVNFWRAGPQRD